MTDEQWRPVAGYETEYAVSNLGRVKRLIVSQSRRRYPAGYMLKSHILPNGYAQCSLHHRSVYIHQLVAAAFIGPCPDGHEVNHKNLKRSDNRADNLEYLTRSQNNKHSYQHGRKAHSRYGEANHNTKLSADDVRIIRAAHAAGQSYGSLGRQFGVHWTSIRSVVKKESHANVE